MVILLILKNHQTVISSNACNNFFIKAFHIYKAPMQKTAPIGGLMSYKMLFICFN
jgi:hypothetical protein